MYRVSLRFLSSSRPSSLTRPLSFPSSPSTSSTPTSTTTTRTTPSYSSSPSSSRSPSSPSHLSPSTDSSRKDNRLHPVAVALGLLTLLSYLTYQHVFRVDVSEVSGGYTPRQSTLHHLLHYGDTGVARTSETRGERRVVEGMEVRRGGVESRKEPVPVQVRKGGEEEGRPVQVGEIRSREMVDEVRREVGERGEEPVKDRDKGLSTAIVKSTGD